MQDLSEESCHGCSRRHPYRPINARCPGKFHSKLTGAGENKGLPLPERFFPQVPGRRNDPGWETPPEKRNYGVEAEDVHLSWQQWFFALVGSRIFPAGFHNNRSGGEFDRQALALEAPRRRWSWPARGISLLSRTLFATTFLVSLACAQERATHKNELGVWVEGQFGNGHAFGSTTDSRMYQVEARYGRLVFTNRLIALRYVADVVPLSVVGDPRANGQRVYAYGAGGSPIGAQVNFLHGRRIQPFLTSGGGFLYFNRQMFGATQFNFTAQLGAGVQVFTSRHHSIDFGYKYHHISNANLGHINPGMDSHLVFVGVSFVP
jgi:opacity protein-like surface antigen